MLAAVCDGDAKELAELMRQDPSFNVNRVVDEYGRTLLYAACLESSRSPVIPLLLAHPDIDVNLTDISESTPFYRACQYGHTSCVRELLKDSRVKVNEASGVGFTPLWAAAAFGHLDIIKWWIASGRELDLGTPGDLNQTDAIGKAKDRGRTEMVTLLERFKENPAEARHIVRVQLGLVDEPAAEMFALVVFVSDGLLQVKKLVDSTPPAARFFRISTQLPLELQMVLCYRVVGSAKEIISGKDGEKAFKDLAKRI